MGNWRPVVALKLRHPFGMETARSTARVVTQWDEGKIMNRNLFAVACMLLTALPALAEDVSVSGSDTTYSSEKKTNVGGKDVTLTLTGAALRKRVFFSVYTVGSYVQQGARVGSAEELASKDCAKQLHLVLERDIKGTDMADAIRSAIRANYDDPQFSDELKVMVEFLSKLEIKKGDNVRLTHVPGKGLHADVEGKAQILIENPAFSRAVWDIYFGKNNLGEAIKTALVARL